jgi:hypothetical protein
MNAQDIRNLQEAYLEVYDLDEAEVLAQKSGSPGTVQVKKTREGGFFGIGGREVNKPVPGTFKPKDVPSIDAARYNTGIDRKFGVDPSDTHSTAASSVQHRARSAGDSGYMKVKDPSSIPDTGRPNRPTPARSSDQNYAIRAGSDIVRMNRLAREQVDIYDIILSHLLDEGYAETPEAAEAIMVNMGEEWRESIMEMDDFAAGGGNAKIKQTGMNKDQVIALGKKNLANVAKKQTPQQPQSSSQPSQVPAPTSNSRTFKSGYEGKSAIRGKIERLRDDEELDALQQKRNQRWAKNELRPGPSGIRSIADVDADRMRSQGQDWGIDPKETEKSIKIVMDRRRRAAAGEM